MKLVDWIRRYRVPITIGAGGVVAVTAFTAAQQRTAAVRAANQVAAGAPLTGAGLTPEQVASLIGQGGQLVIAGQGPLVDLAAGGLSVAGGAAAGAQALSQVALGNLGGALGVLGDLAGQLVGVLPSFAPVAGITPQPTQPPAPVPVPMPILPTPAPAPAPTVIGHRVNVTGTVNLYTLEGGTLVPHRVTFLNSSAPVHIAYWPGFVAWVTDAGALKGYAYLAGLTAPPDNWSISAVYSDGSSVVTNKGGGGP